MVPLLLMQVTRPALLAAVFVVLRDQCPIRIIVQQHPLSTGFSCTRDHA
jgi:hypothetical protein